MSVVNAGLMLSAPSGYTIDRSLRFRSSASAYLSRTFGTPTNATKWTFSAWVKNCGQSDYNPIFGGDSTSKGLLYFHQTANALQFFDPTTGAQLYTTALYRDPSAWYHVIFVFDSTEATSSNRMKWFVNGSQVTSFAFTNYPALNATVGINTAVVHYIGRHVSTSKYGNHYLTEINFIDGQALDPTYFGEYNSDTGVWQPKKYTGTHGTNGFYLNFSDNSTTTTLGYDTSGNGNNWTANNISVTSGVTYDSMTDVPTLTSTDAANFCTWNPLAKSPNQTATDGNLKAVNSSAGYQSILGTLGVSSGKWYFEVTELTNSVGIAETTIDLRSTNEFIPSNQAAWVYSSNGNKISTSGSVAYGASFTSTDVIGVAFDADAGTLTFYKNGTSQGTAFTGLTGAIYAPYAIMLNVQPNATANFGQRPFAYTPPAGFKSLNTYNLLDSTIEDGSEYFDAVLWTGDGSQTRSITGTNFQPDMVWMKLRTGTTQVTQVYDSVRGVGGGQGLSTAETYAEGTMNGGYLDSDYGYISSLDASGFSVNDGVVATTGGWVNYASRPYVAWNWKANGSGVSNTDGSITSTVSANTTAGFSIVTYTGTGSAATVGHGLGVAPKMVIVKARGTPNGSARSWFVYSESVGATKTLYLDLTLAAATTSGPWNNTAPTTSVFSLGNEPSVNWGLSDYVAYCFADVEGYSKFGSYTGNGDPDGPFVYLGFRPAFVLVKRSDSTGNWFIWDSSRDSYNTVVRELYPDSEFAEYTRTGSSDSLDFVSNGFKIRLSSTYTDRNADGGTYIYMAFAENPFKNALAR